MSTESRTETIVVKGDNIMLDLLLWRRFKRHHEGLVERVLDINPGLADLGMVLPLGTVVVIPLDEPQKSAETTKVVRLWD